jgi:hypothetical protein
MNERWMEKCKWGKRKRRRGNGKEKGKKKNSMVPTKLKSRLDGGLRGEQCP